MSSNGSLVVAIVGTFGQLLAGCRSGSSEYQELDLEVCTDRQVQSMPPLRANRQPIFLAQVLVNYAVLFLTLKEFFSRAAYRGGGRFG